MPPLSRKPIHKVHTHSGVWAIRGIADRSLSPYQFPWRVSIFEFIRRNRKKPVMTKRLDNPSVKVSSAQGNGYSIAELLIALSIFVGVLAGVWGTYTMISEEAEVRTILAEIRLLQQAAQRYKKEHGGYQRYSRISYTGLHNLKPYLGSTNSGLRAGVNYRGNAILMWGRPQDTPKHLGFYYYMGGLDGIRMCERLIEHFGKETESGPYGYLKITPGKAIDGFVSVPDDPGGAGCSQYFGLGLTFE